VCRFMSHDGHSHVTVEDLALEHFALPENGSWEGVHSESGVWSTLFGILLWDVLFAPVPDVFRSRFQSAPLDLCTDAFAPARAGVLHTALQRIRSGAALEMLESVWKLHKGALSCGHALCVRVPYIERDGFSLARLHIHTHATDRH
jgi:fanconi-associated nuclease 1